MTCGVGFVVKIMVFLKKLRVASNSSSTLLLCFCSKIIVSFVVGAREANGST
jgi:hypothetical protein